MEEPQRHQRLEPATSDTTLTSDDAFVIGQLFNAACCGPLTQITIAAFGADDTTPFPLTDLDFEQHGIPSFGEAAVLTWDPSLGLLRNDVVNTSSGYGFFSPSSGEIGMLVITADTYPSTVNGDRIVLGLAVPLPEPAIAILLGAAGLALCARKRAPSR